MSNKSDIEPVRWQDDSLLLLDIMAPFGRIRYTIPEVESKAATA